MYAFSRLTRKILGVFLNVVLCSNFVSYQLNIFVLNRCNAMNDYSVIWIHDTQGLVIQSQSISSHSA